MGFGLRRSCGAQRACCKGKQREGECPAHMGFIPMVALAPRKPLILQLNCNRLYFCILLKPVLTKLAPNAGLLEAAKWGSRVEHVIAVHPYRTCANVVRDVMRVGDIARPNGRR